MSKITDGLPGCDRLGNEIYTDFRGMLKMQEVFENPGMEQSTKWVMALTLLYGEQWEKIEHSLQDLAQELSWFYSAGDEEAQEERLEGEANFGKRLYDFVEDEDYIIGGFEQVYGIDLTSEELELHWWRFMALFKSLPESTEMMNRMKIRGTDTSHMKGEEKRHYEKIKAAVALKKQAGGWKKLSLKERLMRRKKIEQTNKTTG